jgi:hypothetical protein
VRGRRLRAVAAATDGGRLLPRPSAGGGGWVGVVAPRGSRAGTSREEDTPTRPCLWGWE